MPLAVVAVGGNSLIQLNQTGTIEEQFENAAITARAVADLIEDDWQVILTHGNGPQVGRILLRVELAAPHVVPVPLEIADANTEGGLGYMLQQVVGNELRRRGIDKTIVTLISQVVVDPKDPAFENPTKPIGPFFDPDVAQEKIQNQGWVMEEDSGRGWRRVVASPRPIRFVEEAAVAHMMNGGIIPIAVGGGGVPVTEEDGQLRGISAVIDKDFTSSLLAQHLNAHTLVISTGPARTDANLRGKVEVWRQALDELLE